MGGGVIFYYHLLFLINITNRLILKMPIMYMIVLFTED